MVREARLRGEAAHDPPHIRGEQPSSGRGGEQDAPRQAGPAGRPLAGRPRSGSVSRLAAGSLSEVGIDPRRGRTGEGQAPAAAVLRG